MASMYNATYVCKNKTHEACSNNVAKQLGMRIIETIDDGDCFFDTLATYGWAYHYNPLERPHQELRQMIVDYMVEHMGEVAPYVIVNENKGETIESMIESLREDMVWNNDMGDLLSQIAAEAFHVNIYIYNVEPPTIRRLRANQIPYPGDPIHMLRVGQHYQLLLPQEAAPHVIGSYASAHKNTSKKSKSKTAKKSNNNSKNGNSVSKLSHALSKASISNKTHKNHKNHGNQMNHQLLKNRQDLQEYEKITVARLHKVLRSFGVSEKEINDTILSLPKKEQKTAYYDHYVSLLS